LLARLNWIKAELMPAVALVKNSSHPLAALATPGLASLGCFCVHSLKYSVFSLSLSDFTTEVANWCPPLWTLTWLTHLVIDLHRHLHGQRDEKHLGDREIEYAGPSITDDALAQALGDLKGARELLLKLVPTLQNLGADNIGKKADYDSLQAELDRVVQDGSGSGTGHGTKRKSPSTPSESAEPASKRAKTDAV
jgi:hypothetical protein